MNSLKNKLTINENNTANNIEIFIFNLNSDEEQFINLNSNHQQFLKDCEYIINKLTKRYFKVFFKQQLNYSYNHIQFAKDYSKTKNFTASKNINKPDLKSINKFFNSLNKKIEMFKFIRKRINQKIGDMDVILEKETLLKEFYKLGYEKINKTNTVSIYPEFDKLVFKEDKIELVSILNFPNLIL